MEDSSWSGWATPPPPPGFDLGYPEGEESSPADRRVAGMVSCRSTPKANDETIRFASRMWPQVPPEEFERTGRRRRDHTSTQSRDAQDIGNRMVEPRSLGC